MITEKLPLCNDVPTEWASFSKQESASDPPV
jgi:hypothetical protein